MERIIIGDVEIRRVIEWRGPISTVAEILPDTPPDVWADNRSWLSPDFWDPGTNAYEAVVQTWVLRSAGRTILIDTGVGNDRDRPQIPQFSHLHTDFLDRLAAAGVRPEDVDVVVNTHIYYDHVGWNTRRATGTPGCRPSPTPPTSSPAPTTTTTTRSTRPGCARPATRTSGGASPGCG